MEILCLLSLNLLCSVGLEVLIPNRVIFPARNTECTALNQKLSCHLGTSGSSGQGTSRQAEAEMTNHNHQGLGQLLVHKRSRKERGAGRLTWAPLAQVWWISAAIWPQKNMATRGSDNSGMRIEVMSAGQPLRPTGMMAKGEHIWNDRRGRGQWVSPVAFLVPLTFFLYSFLWEKSCIRIVEELFSELQLLLALQLYLLVQVTAIFHLRQPLSCLFASTLGSYIIHNRAARLNFWKQKSIMLFPAEKTPHVFHCPNKLQVHGPRLHRPYLLLPLSFLLSSLDGHISFTLSRACQTPSHLRSMLHLGVLFVWDMPSTDHMTGPWADVTSQPL